MNLESHQIPATESPAVLENTNTPSHDSERLGHSDTDFEKNSTENVVPGPQSLTESGYITYPSSVEVTGSVILEGNTSLYQYYPSRNIRPSQELEETVCNDNQNLPESHGENDAAVHFVENVGDEEDQMSIDSLSEKDVIDSHLQGEPQEILEGIKNLNLFTEILHGREEPQEVSEGTENLNLFTEVSDAMKEPQEISEGTENGYCLDCSEPVTKLSRDVYHLIGDSSRTLAQRQSPGSDNGLSLIQGIHQANSVSPSAPVHSTFDLRRIFESQFHLHPHNYLMRALDEISLYSQEGCHGTLRTPLQPVLSTFGLNRHHNADHRLDVPLLSDRHSDALEPIPSPAQMVRIGEDSRSSAEVQRLEAPAGHLAGACHMSVEETDQVEIHDVDLDSHRAPSVENFQQLAFPQPNDIDVAIDLRAHKDARRENNLIFNNVARCFHCRVRVPKVQNIPCGHCTFCLICSFRFDPCPTCHCPVVRHEPFTF